MVKAENTNKWKEKTQELTNFKVGPKEILQIWISDHIESQRKKCEDISVSFLTLFCIKECKDVLARDIKLFSTSWTFRLSKGSIYFSFSYRERELVLIKDREACPQPYITWDGAFDYNIFDTIIHYFDTSYQGTRASPVG